MTGAEQARALADVTAIAKEVLAAVASVHDAESGVVLRRDHQAAFEARDEARRAYGVLARLHAPALAFAVQRNEAALREREKIDLALRQELLSLEQSLRETREALEQAEDRFATIYGSRNDEQITQEAYFGICDCRAALARAGEQT